MRMTPVRGLLGRLEEPPRRRLRSSAPGELSPRAELADVHPESSVAPPTAISRRSESRRAMRCRERSEAMRFRSEFARGVTRSRRARRRAVSSSRAALSSSTSRLEARAFSKSVAERFHQRRALMGRHRAYFVLLGSRLENRPAEEDDGRAHRDNDDRRAERDAPRLRAWFHRRQHSCFWTEPSAGEWKSAWNGPMRPGENRAPPEEIRRRPCGPASGGYTEAGAAELHAEAPGEVTASDQFQGPEPGCWRCGSRYRPRPGT